MRVLLLLSLLAGCREALPPGHGRVSGTAVVARGESPMGVLVHLVTGSKTDEDRAPVMLSRYGTPSPRLASELDGGVIARAHVTSASGDFALDVAPGTYHLVLEPTGAQGPARVIVPAIEVFAGSVSSVGDVQLFYRQSPMDHHDGHEAY